MIKNKRIWDWCISAVHIIICWNTSVSVIMMSCYRLPELTLDILPSHEQGEFYNIFGQQPHSQLVIFWPPAFWLQEHHTWSSHPWWLPCVTTSRSCANNVNCDIFLGRFAECGFDFCPFSALHQCLSSQRDGCLYIFDKVCLFTPLLNDSPPEWW